MARNDLIIAATIEKKIKMLTGFSTTVRSSFTTGASTHSSAVAWDGTDILYENDSGTNCLKKGTGFASTVQSSFTAPGNYTYDMHWDGMNLLTAEGQKGYKMTGFSSTVLASFTLSAAYLSLRGIAWDGSNALGNDVYNPPGTYYSLYKFSGFSSTVTASFLTNDKSARGVTWDGTNIYSALLTSGKIRKHDGFSSTVLSSLSVSNICGIDYDLLTVVAPTVTTQAATSITSDSFVGNGNITSTGGANATRRGFCYFEGSSGDPTIADSVVYEDGDFGTGAFDLTIDSI